MGKRFGRRRRKKMLAELNMLRPHWEAAQKYRCRLQHADPFQGAIASIRFALEVGNWFAALGMTLMLPDIASGLEYGRSKPGERYPRWFDDNVGSKYRILGPEKTEVIFLSGKDCYALRCALLHEWQLDTSSQPAHEALTKFHFQTMGSHCNIFDDQLQLNVTTFCSDICKAAEAWHASLNDQIKDKIRAELLVVHEQSYEIIPYVRFA